jgi:hydroxylamine reductase
MFCYQCQETAKNSGCTARGVCGKDARTADLHDLLIYILQGISLLIEKSGRRIDREPGLFLCQALFATITNVNFDEDRIVQLILKALELREKLKKKYGVVIEDDRCQWTGAGKEDFTAKAPGVGILSYSQNEDIRSLKSMLLYGLKGIAAYTDHAAVLGQYNEDIFVFMVKGLVAIAKDLPVDALTALVMEAGSTAVKAMELLDKANTAAYGIPEITKVDIGVRARPGILISGHDLKDLEELLIQSEGKGVDVYTHGEMLPAHYYPAFKKHSHFAGNYGGSWWKQNGDFEAFNGPIVMSTNCIIPVKDSYKNRIFTTGVVGYPGVKHIPDRQKDAPKDFSEVIALAKISLPPKQLETGEITGGFAHNQALALADKIVAAVKSGAIKRFVVMAGCDGRQQSRSYFTGVAEGLPAGTVILTAGCAKYRYNKLKLGDIGGIPRVIDAGQCNDSYSLAVIALKLKEAFGLDDVNKLPISFDVAWYEQKAVAVLLALLALGFKNIRLGPTLPAFVSPGVLKLLIEKFELKPVGSVAEDVAAMMAGK